MRQPIRPSMIFRLVLLGLPGVAAESQKAALTVFAAGSLTSVLLELGKT